LAPTKINLNKLIEARTLVQKNVVSELRHNCSTHQSVLDEKWLRNDRSKLHFVEITHSLEPEKHEKYLGNSDEIRIHLGK